MAHPPLRIGPTQVGLGLRVRLLRDVERYPHFTVPKGRTGRIVHVDSQTVTIKMDRFFKGGKPWDYLLDLNDFERLEDHDFADVIEVVS